MFIETSTFLRGKCVGIIGCGNLGITLADALVNRCGLSKTQLLISSRGSRRSLRNLEQAGLSNNSVSNETLCAESMLILLALPPQEFCRLANFRFSKDALVVSLMAGVTIASVANVVGVRDIMRIMPSGPDTIRSHKAIAAIFPPKYKALTELPRCTIGQKL